MENRIKEFFSREDQNSFGELEYLFKNYMPAVLLSMTEDNLFRWIYPDELEEEAKKARR